MINLNLVLILEPHIDILKLIEEAVLGGVTCVQWRDKFYNDRDFYEQALLIKKLCDRLNVSLIINDRVDIALAVGADGVHLGKSDFPYEAARKILPENMIIGGTAETLEDVIEAEKYDLGYLSIVPVFTSSNKASVGEPWGLEGLKKARALSRHRLLATGGITVENARIIRDIGIDGLAVASHICREASHCEAARAFC
jgi:thiamine-phosphate pyrophosphorylase